ncbi:MAG: hypothetical protein OXB98_03725 [Bryobacterales bacterium]|nr:hypothetical protein [Bryobacterales bacterium]
MNPLARKGLLWVLVGAAVSAFAQANRKVIPYIAQDEHSITWIHAINACSKTVSYHLAFESVDGPESFSVENNEGLWQGIYIEEMAPRSNHFWVLPKTASGIVRTGYAMVRDDSGGCVSFDMAYGEEVDAGDMRVALGFVSETSAAGVAQPFINSTGCDTGVAVVGSGQQVSIEATDWQGNPLGSSSLGPVRYQVFLVNTEFPRAAGEEGLVQITGGDVASLGFIICNERLVWSRRSYPIPGAGGGITTGRPGASASEYEIVEFAAKLIAIDTTGIAGHTYSYRLKLKNPSPVDHKYRVEVRFRDSDGFVVAGERVNVWDGCYCVPAGQTRLFEGTFLNNFRADQGEYTVEAAITVLE